MLTDMNRLFASFKYRKCRSQLKDIELLLENTKFNIENTVNSNSALPETQSKD
jgi:hypothetical protein